MSTGHKPLTYTSCTIRCDISEIQYKKKTTKHAWTNTLKVTRTDKLHTEWAHT